MQGDTEVRTKTGSNTRNDALSPSPVCALCGPLRLVPQFLKTSASRLGSVLTFLTSLLPSLLFR